MIRLSVCICTLNPSAEIFPQVINALQAQSLSLEQWEVVVVDNGNEEPIEDAYANLFSWHKSVRFIVEPEQGYAPARRTAIVNARGEFIVFVDDDCILGKSYLEKALAIMDIYPLLGVLGGNIDFLIPENVGRLNREFHHARFGFGRVQGFLETNDPGSFSRAFSGGAGMVVRKSVCGFFLKRIEDYKGMSAILSEYRLPPLMFEDWDISIGAMQQGFSIARSDELNLAHKTPQNEMSVMRFLRVNYVIGFFWEIQKMRWGWSRYDNKFKSWYSLRWYIYGFILKCLRQRSSFSNFIMNASFELGVLNAQFFLLRNQNIIYHFQVQGNKLE